MGTSPSPAPKRMEAALQGAEDVQPGLVWVPKTHPGALLSLAPLTPRKLPVSSAVAWGHRGAGDGPCPGACPCRCLHPPVRGGAGPGEVLGAERRGPRCHGLLNGGFLAVGLEERRRPVGQHRPLVTAEFGPPVLKPDLHGEGEALAGSRGRPRCPSHHPDPRGVRGEEGRGVLLLPHKPVLTWTLASLRFTLLASSSRTKASG